MNIPKLPNDIIFKILKHRREINYLDKKYEEAQFNKINLLDELNYLNEDLNLSIQIMFDNNDCDEEEIEELENSSYSELLLENIINYNYYLECDKNLKFEDN